MPGAIEYSRLFQNKRNRIEFISDFPEENDAEVISSLEIHPQGWVAVTRNVSADEGSEVRSALTTFLLSPLLNILYHCRSSGVVCMIFMLPLKNPRLVLTMNKANKLNQT